MELERLIVEADRGDEVGLSVAIKVGVGVGVAMGVGVGMAVGVGVTAGYVVIGPIVTIGSTVAVASTVAVDPTGARGTIVGVIAAISQADGDVTIGEADTCVGSVVDLVATLQVA